MMPQQKMLLRFRLDNLQHLCDTKRDRFTLFPRGIRQTPCRVMKEFHLTVPAVNADFLHVVNFDTVPMHFQRR